MKNSYSLCQPIPLKFVAVIATLAFTIICTFFSHAYAHHPFEDGVRTYSVFDGLLSGLAHPVLGLDHLLFLVSIGLAGITSQIIWALSLLGVGLLGSVLVHFLPSVQGAELLMGLSLIASAFVALGRLRPMWMVPLIFSHGYVLGESMIGAEPTPLLTYILGLLISEAIIISIGLKFLPRWWHKRGVIAGCLFGAGMTMTYATFFGLT